MCSSQSGTGFTSFNSMNVSPHLDYAQEQRVSRVWKTTMVMQIRVGFTVTFQKHISASEEFMFFFVMVRW